MIPVFEPSIGEEEIAAVVAALRDGEISGSFGKNIERFEEDFASFCGVPHGVAVSSGTAALHLAVAALGLDPGAEVLMSASTNIATALGAVHNSLIPVPVDSEPATWNLDLDLLEALVTPRSRALIPVHLYGCPIDMDRLMAFAQRHDLIVIEDCAESHGATWRGRMTGSFGTMSCFSFYANKVITTGEGGMVLTGDPELAERLRLLRNLAFTTPRFRHERAGYNFRMTGYQAAMGRAQLAKIDTIIEEKRRIGHRYTELLAGIPGLTLPSEPEGARHVFWMYGVVIDPEVVGRSRDEVMSALRNRGIDTRTFFCPLDQQPFLRDLPGFPDVTCPVAGGLWDNAFYLPSSITLDDPTLAYVSDVLREILSSGEA